MNGLHGSCLITGGTGYIGSSIVNALLQNGDARISIIVRDAEKASRLFGDRVKIIAADITDSNAMESINGEFDYIFHCAANTTSSLMVSDPVMTADGIVLGTRNVLELARRCHSAKVLYLSSMEVYGNVGDSSIRTDETELGDIDIHNIRSCYPLGKRMAEYYCYAYYKEYNVPVVSVRLAQTFGHGVRYEDSRVYAQFAHCMLENKDIVLHTKGESMGNYVAVDDALSALFMLIDYGQAGQAYNVVNEALTMTIADMAHVVADTIMNGQISVIYDIPEENEFGYAANTALRLSGAKLEALGWKPQYSMEDMYAQIIDGWKNQGH